MNSPPAYCYNCGAALPPSANFCPACGQLQPTDTKASQERSRDPAPQRLVRLNPSPSDDQNRTSKRRSAIPPDLLRFLKWAERNIVWVTIGLIVVLLVMFVIVVSWGLGKPAGDTGPDGSGAVQAMSNTQESLQSGDGGAARALSMLDEAQAAAFPDGMKADTADGTVTYKPGRLIEASFGPVFVNEGEIENGPYVAGGVIALHYLARDGGTLKVIRAFRYAATAGSFGSVGEWSLSDQFSRYPVIVEQAGSTGQGETCNYTTLTEVRPSGPVELVSFMSGYDDSGSHVDGDPEKRSVTGKITNIEPGKSFHVEFSGTASFSADYVREGAKYHLLGSTADHALSGC